MKLIVGLGNPEPDYRGTRHNLGRWCVEQVAAYLDLAPFQSNDKLGCTITRLDDADHHWFFAYPNSFMNESGVAVVKLVHFYRLELTDLLIIHDDVDVPFGAVRLVNDRGAAGHKGVASVIEQLKTQAFHRLRVGLGSNRDAKLPSEAYVLQKFTAEEQAALTKVVPQVVEAILKWAR